MSADPNILPAPERTKQRNEAFTELVKALLIINGGGAVALLAFLQATWVHSRALAQPTVISIAIMSFGALLAAATHLFRYQASWHHQSGNDAQWAKFRRFYLVCASTSLLAFALGVVVIVVGVLRAL